jgi:hypothetical protein
LVIYRYPIHIPLVTVPPPHSYPTKNPIRIPLIPNHTINIIQTSRHQGEKDENIGIVGARKKHRGRRQMHQSTLDGLVLDGRNDI